MRRHCHFLLICLLSLVAAVPARADTSTANKGYSNQSTGANRGQWGITLNNNFSIIDKNVGGRLAVDVSGNSNITVSAGNAQYLYHKLTGTLTGNIQYILPDAGGFYIIENATSGAYTVKIDNILGGAGIIIAQGTTTLVYDNADDNAVVSGITSIAGVMLGANNLSDVADAVAAFTFLKQPASEAATGVCQLATTAQAAAGADTAKCVTAAGVASAITAQASSLPAGTVVFYAGASAPAGYVLGYGEALSRTTYANLFSAIGTVYGIGDGSTTFNVPDCRGRAVFGKDDMGGSAAGRLTNAVTGGIDGVTLGASGGERAHTQSIAEMPAHHHIAGSPALIGDGVTYRYGLQGGFSPSIGYSASSSTNRDSSPLTSDTGSGSPFNVTPPGIVLNCLLKT